MRYNEIEELESTREWLLRFNEAGFSEELMYVPSQLSKLGVAPIDVVDRLDWLKEIDKERPIAPLEEVGALILDYDSYGPWEWAGSIEKMIEDASASIFDLDPDLPDFNELVSLLRPKRRARGKRVRAVVSLLAS